MDMALRRPTLLGGGEGTCDPPTGSADGCACRLDGTRAWGGAHRVTRLCVPWLVLCRCSTTLNCFRVQLVS